MISFQQIEYILTLSEELHFQKASDRCFVSQPTLSMQLKKAEEVLGQPIFDRTKSPIELTTFGERIVPMLRDVQVEYNRIEDFVKKESGTSKEVIRMAVIPTIASYLIPDLYHKWQAAIKDVQLIIEELKTEDLLIELEKGKIDIGILSGPVNNPKWKTNILFQEEILAYYPAGNEDTVLTDDLIQIHPWLLTPGNCLRTQMMHFCSLKGKDHTEDWDYQGGNIDLLMNMVDKHGGYTLVPSNHEVTIAKNLKTIKSAIGEIPAREIIAISNDRSLKWDNMEKIIREIQLNYNQPRSSKNLQLLGWK